MDQCNLVSNNNSKTSGFSLELNFIPGDYSIPATVYLVIVDFLIIVGNSWIMFRIVSTFRKSMYLLASLVVSDFLTGITSIPLYLVWIHNKELFVSGSICFGTMMISLFLSVASILNIIAMTTERYIAVCFPLFHRTVVLVRYKNFITLIILIVWFSSFGIMLSSLHFMSRDYEVCSYYNVFQNKFLIWAIVFGVFSPLCLLSAMYIKMFIAVRKCFDRERFNSVPRLSSVSERSDEKPISKWANLKQSMPFIKLKSNDEIQMERQTPERRCSEQEANVPKERQMSQISNGRNRMINKSLKKMITTLSLVLTCFIVCWGPFFVTIFLRLVCSNCQMPFLAYEIILLLGFSNSLANPVIYCLRHKSFRFVKIQERYSVSETTSKVRSSLTSQKCSST